MKRLIFAAILLSWTAAIILGQDAPQDEPPVEQNYATRAAARPAPQIEGLAERAAEILAAGDTSDFLFDLLKLREDPAPEAAAELAKILAWRERDDTTFYFAAAQALFNTGGVQARTALEQHLLRPSLQVELAVRYTSHWDMGEPQRSRFMETYLLRNLSDDLGVSVDARWAPPAAQNPPAASETLLVEVTLSNRTAGNLGVYHPRGAANLYFRSPSGVYAPAVRGARGESRPNWARLAPNESTSFTATLTLQNDPQTIQRLAREEPDARAALSEGRTFAFALNEFGQYQLSAMFVQLPQGDSYREQLRLTREIDDDEIWTGRAVSAPVTIEIRDPSDRP